MADESIDSLVTPAKNENASKSDSYHAGDSSTRNSIEKSNSANNNRNVVPHYLRASTGSCHDFCKYGKKHSSEEKARKPLPKRITKSLPNDHPVQIMVSGEQNKEKVVDQKPLADTKNHSPDLRKPKISSDAKIYCPNKKDSSGKKSVLLKSKSLSTKKCPSPEPPEIVKSVFFPSKKDEDPVKKGSLADKFPKAEKRPTYLFSPVKSKPVKVKPLLLSSSSDNSGGIRGKGREVGESNAGRNMTTSEASAKKVLTAPRAATLSTKLPIIKTAHNNSRKAGNSKLVSHPKDRNRMRGKWRKVCESNTGRNMTTSEASAKKVLTAPCAATLSTKLPIIKTAHNNSRKAGNSKLVSHPKDINRMRRVHKTKTSDDEKVSEKILHVVETENKNNVIEPVLSLPSPPSAESQSHENSSFLSSHEEDNEEIEYSNGEADELVISDKNESLEIISKVVVVSEDNKNRSPVKLKFRNGKVVDVQSNINSPKRLIFRRARVIGPDEGKSDLRRRIFKKAAVSDDKTGEKVSSEKVVLKHQDVQGKKDAQGLLNNVIEQTASKLAESRKSKVKALVGAFETVISLQESRPSPQAVGF